MLLIWLVPQDGASAKRISLKPSSTVCRDCWSVAFGNSFNDEERCVLAGYDNGDVKLFDLRTNKVLSCPARHTCDSTVGCLISVAQCLTMCCVAADSVGDQCWKRSVWSPIRPQGH
jgi:hypothetical protein